MNKIRFIFIGIVLIILGVSLLYYSYIHYINMGLFVLPALFSIFVIFIGILSMNKRKLLSDWLEETDPNI